MTWDWVAAFDAEHADDGRSDYVTAFLEEIGEHAFALGTVLASLDSADEDYVLAFVTPTQFDELARLFTAHRMTAERVRRGWRTFTPAQDAAIIAWAKTQRG